MSEATFVQGDTDPAITATLTVDGVALNLSGSTVRFQMRKEDDKRFTVNAAATIVSAAAGTVRYQWGTNDLAVPGEYYVQWEVTYPTGRVQTQAAPSVVTVRRQ
jgi:hypothetical protein